ncbi:hypothetical protein BC835DRAFT_1263607 [Cytidiella melzeri]|nr:hypothetical protein BC835DRAFT_1263607 [Cytidiella melzeri]
MASTSTSSSSSDFEQPKTTKRKLDAAKDDSQSDDAASFSDSVDSDAEPAVEEDVPVLSHKELRRQKKKQQRIQQDGVDSATANANKNPKLKNTAELAPSKIPKRQNSVWVGNLSFKTTPDALRHFFNGVGEITRVHMPMKMSAAGPGSRGAVKENRGFAYVDFPTPEAKTIAITLSENHLDGRRLLIKDGDDFAGRPSTSTDAAGAEGENKLSGQTKTAQKILRSQKQPAGPTLFLGNLGFETTEQSIRGMLESHHLKKADAEQSATAEGNTDEPGASSKKWIRKIRMGTFEDTGKCKGWAFVDFFTTDDATTALTNPKNHFLDGRKLVCEFASPEAVRRGGAGRRDDKDKIRPVGSGNEGDQPAKRRKGDGEDEVGGEGGAVSVYGGRDRKERSRDGRLPKVRAKPGAALANAKREAVSIVPSQGKKTVF